jgi:hypothetical protein
MKYVERPVRFTNPKAMPVDPLPLAMLSPASAVGARMPPESDPAVPEFVVVSEPPPARVLP